MKPTTFKNILSFIFVASIVGYFLSSIYENLTATFFPLNINTIFALFILNMALLYWINVFRSRLKNAREKNQELSKRKFPPHPLVSARTVALAFAGSRAGSLILGFYFGIVIEFLPKFELTPIKQRLAIALGIIALSAVLIALSLWLEKICRINDSDDKPGVNTSFA